MDFTINLRQTRLPLAAVYAKTILSRAKRHRDNLVQNVISHINIYDFVSLMSLDATGQKESI